MNGKGVMGEWVKNRFFPLLAAGLVFLMAAGQAAGATPPAGAARLSIGELEFKEARVRDAVRIISELTRVNIVATNDAGEKMVTIYVRDLTVGAVVDAICRVSGLWYRYNPDTGIYIIMTTREYQKDIVVFKHEPTRMFHLKYMNVGLAARTISDLFGDRVELNGKANLHLGDDYSVGDISGFTEDYNSAEQDEDDDSSDDGDNDNTSNRKDTQSSWQTQGGSKDGGLSVLQLAKLEAEAKSQAEAPIYITINRLHNMLFVRTADEKAMDEIAQIIKDSDQQVPEVLLEMKVLEVELTDDFESAFNLSYVGGSSESGPDDGQVINPLNSSATSVGSTLLGMGSSSLLSSSTMVFQVLSGNLRARIQLLEEKNNIKTLATPMLLAANNHPAKLFIGEETVLTTGFTVKTTESETTSGTTITVATPVPETEVQEIGNTLTILPSINADRSVVMRIVHENSSVSENGGKIPLYVDDAIENVYIDTVTTSTLEGTVLAMDGMTVAVGGMMRTSSSDQESKVPLLGDIPGLGNLFKSKTKTETKTEMILLITPHVLTTPSAGQDLSKRRLDALSSQAGEIEGFKDRPDLSTIPGDVPGADLKAPEQKGRNDLKQQYVAMTRVAVRQVRQPFGLRKAQDGVRPVPFSFAGTISFFDDPEISSTPVAAWTDGNAYLTAVRVSNFGEAAKHLDAADVRGDWRAATLEARTLAPMGKPGTFTYLYLISDRSFGEAVSPGSIR